MKKTILSKLLLAAIVFTASFIIFFLVLLKYLSENTSNPLLYFPKLFLETKHKPSLPPDLNILLLGLDPREDSLEITKTTDTIILVNIGQNHKISLISIPRDLWDYQLKSKVNQIYPLSQVAADPLDYVQSNFSRLTGVNIERTLVLTTKNLIDIVNIIGGVDLYLEQGFRDDLFPNPDYINNPQPNIAVYKTVEFPQGWVHLDASNIGDFVRSRKSAQTAQDGGTDLGRIIRQQLLIDALVQKLKTYKYYQNPRMLFSLYNYWLRNIETNLTDRDIFSLGWQLSSHLSDLEIRKVEIPAGEDQKVNIIYHPPWLINSQWVYLPQDPNYISFRQFIQQNFYGSD